MQMIDNVRVTRTDDEFGIRHPNGDIFVFQDEKQAVKIAGSIPGAKVQYHARYVTDWIDA
ncbi:MAG: hypothetical protein ACREHG_00505 [Candidatus Saccharimonadales bacterium]